MPDLLKAKKSLRMSKTNSGCASKAVAEAEQEETMSQETEEAVMIVAKEMMERTAKTEVRAAEVAEVEVVEEEMENIVAVEVVVEAALMENMAVVVEAAEVVVQE